MVKRNDLSVTTDQEIPSITVRVSQQHIKQAEHYALVGLGQFIWKLAPGIAVRRFDVSAIHKLHVQIRRASPVDRRSTEPNCICDQRPQFLGVGLTDASYAVGCWAEISWLFMNAHRAVSV